MGKAEVLYNNIKFTGRLWRKKDQGGKGHKQRYISLGRRKIKRSGTGVHRVASLFAGRKKACL